MKSGNKLLEGTPDELLNEFKNKKTSKEAKEILESYRKKSI